MNVESYVAVARQQQARRNWRAAARALDDALALAPGDAAIHDLRGQVSHKLKQYAEAEKSYQRALTIAPSLHVARLNLARLYRERQLMPQAIALLEALPAGAGETAATEAQAMLDELRQELERTCAICGCTSPLVEQFHQVKRRGWVCPRCLGKIELRRQQNSFRLLVVFLGSVAIIFGLGLLAGSESYELANLGLLYVAIYLLIIPHELSHALAGWLAGCRVFEIRLGVGPVLATWRIGGVRLALHRYPLAGLCLAAPTRLAEMRQQVLILTAGGPLFNLLLLLVLLPGFSFAQAGQAFAWREVLVVASLVHIVSLFLGRVWVGGTGMLPDGIQIWLLLSGRWQAGYIYAAHYLAGAVFSWQHEDYKAALQYAEDGLVAFPGHPQLASVRGVALIELGRAAEARPLFEALNVPERDEARARQIPQPGQRTQFRAMNLNNLAYARLLAAGDPDEMGRARAEAREAYRLLPWLAAIEGTLGATMIATGEPAAGIEHVKAAGRDDQRARDRASHQAWLAAGLARLGQPAEARQALAAAERLDPMCPALALARAVLAEEQPHPLMDLTP